MTQDLILSAPGVYIAMLGLIQTAGAAQDPVISVYGFEVGASEPDDYIEVLGFKDHHIKPETIGTFSQIEEYSITGRTTVFTGASPVDDPNVGIEILQQTYDIFQAVVMTPLMSNRNEPILGTLGPSPYLMLPESAEYDAGVGTIGDGPGGWAGWLDWSFHFEAYLTPQ